jgi:aminobenzoyl-glutamate utilization protein B
MRDTEQIRTIVDSKREEYAAPADRAWDTPELAYGEHRSAAEHLATLQQEDFRITREDKDACLAKSRLPPYR